MNSSPNSTSMAVRPWPIKPEDTLHLIGLRQDNKEAFHSEIERTKL